MAHILIVPLCSFHDLMNSISYKNVGPFGVVIYPKATLVQKVTCVHSNCSSFFINMPHFVDNTASIDTNILEEATMYLILFCQQF